MQNQNTETKSLKERVTNMSTKKKAITAVAALAVVLGGAGVTTAVVYKHNTKTMCAEAVANYTAQADSINTAKAAATKAVDAANKTESYNATDEGKQLIKAVNDAMNNASANKVPTCDSRDEAAAISNKANTVATSLQPLKDATTKLDKSVENYITAKLIKEAQAKLAEATKQRDEAVKNADASLKSAHDSGYADSSDEAKKLVADVNAKLEAAKKVNTDGTAKTREDAKKITAKVGPVQDATKQLNDAVKQLNDKVNAHNEAKRIAAEKAAAEKAAAKAAAERATQHQSRRSYSNSSNSSHRRSGSSRPAPKRHTRPAPAPAPEPTPKHSKVPSPNEFINYNLIKGCIKDPRTCS